MAEYLSGLHRTYDMIHAMSSEERRGRHGIALMQFLDPEFERLGVAPTTWAAERGITKTNWKRWRDGEADPDISSLVVISEALNRPLLDLLIAAAYLPPNVCDDERPPLHTPWPDVRDAIERDRRITDDTRELLRGVLRMSERLAPRPPRTERRKS